MTLWNTGSQKNSDLAQLVNDFTVGNDYLLDLELIPYDVQASIAHAEGLESIGILTASELQQLTDTLNEILALHQTGKFTIDKSQEDGHTAIEEYLVEQLGETGKKIHTGRSRNDQVLVAMRLWERNRFDQIISSTKELAKVFHKFATKHEFVPMPGLTHTQIAMPCSVGMWAGALAEMLIMNLEALINFRKTINRSPLGSAAGFGVSFDLPREAIATRLGFDDCLQISLTSQNTRGKIEADLVSHLTSLSSTLAHFANDLVWFSSSNFQWFSLPESLTTGSSIMPQKKNVDPAELLRASHAKLLGHEIALKALTQNLVSGYHRDLQLSKEPTMQAVHTVQSCLSMAQALIENLEPNKEKLIAAFSPEILAADQANDLVKQGLPFRDAYLQVKNDLNLTPDKGELEGVSLEKIQENLKSKKHLGAPGNLGLVKLQTQLNNL